MKIHIFSREANPSVDSAKSYAHHSRLTLIRGKHFIDGQEVVMLSDRRAQYVNELRDPIKRAASVQRPYSDGGENGRMWRIVDQTPKGGTYPTAPSWQLVP